MALPWSRDVAASVVVYDSMDYLAGFQGAPAGLLELEDELLQRVDAVFCGGASLHDRMRRRHWNSHCFPSSVDVDHFGAARKPGLEPEDQRAIARPRIGYAGVIDERIDLPLIHGVSLARPDWQIVLVGPTVKIDPAAVPATANIHRLGMKPYAELPGYLRGWDVGWMPFARNEATRFISPTKTPEYLAAGCRVVSTPVRDVVRPYGEEGMVAIASTAAEFGTAITQALESSDPEWRVRVDKYLGQLSWDRTWADMRTLVEDALRKRAGAARAETSRRVHLAFNDRRSAPRSAGPAAPSMGRADV
jgi:UDP-galactopyranose mutase